MAHVIDIIYKDILKSFEEVKKLKIEEERKREEKIFGFSLSDIYFPLSIQNHIIQNIQSSVLFSTIINKRLINLKFYITSKKDMSYDFSLCAKYAFMIIYLLSSYAQKNCSNILNIDIYFTELKKRFPERENEELDKINVNSGFSNVGCRRESNITIYRKEEWFKVLIHELFHNFNLDFTEREMERWKGGLYGVFKIKGDYNIFETYCEVWARILNVAFVSFKEIMNENRLSQKNFKIQFNKNIKYEQEFSLYQSKKVYKKLMKFREKKERSNIMCYYIFTAILLNNYKNFLNWSKRNNINLFRFKNTLKNIDSFVDLLIKEYMDMDFNKTGNNIFFKNSKMLRMTYIE